MSVSDGADSSSWRDGRSVGHHIVDRALDYAALQRSGLSAAQIARRRKKSNGYVSIVLRLGIALRTLDREEIAVFRSDRITWKLVQRLVRTGVTDAEIQRQLRYALGGFSTHNIDRRKLRKHQTKRDGTISTATRSGSPDADMTRSAPEAGAFIWRWDAAWAARDPGGYVDAYRAHLASLHRAIRARFNEAASSRASSGLSDTTRPSIPMVGQSLREIMAGLARQRAAGSRNVRFVLSPADREALASLAALDALIMADQPRGVTTSEAADEPELE